MNKEDLVGLLALLGALGSSGDVSENNLNNDSVVSSYYQTLTKNQGKFQNEKEEDYGLCWKYQIMDLDFPSDKADGSILHLYEIFGFSITIPNFNEYTYLTTGIPDITGALFLIPEDYDFNIPIEARLVGTYLDYQNYSTNSDPILLKLEKPNDFEALINCTQKGNLRE